jgi:hypothetical protein
MKTKKTPTFSEEGKEMLRVQEYLKSGKTLADLTTELGINVAAHPTLPLVVLNYDQIESPKTHPIVRECRALILHATDFSIVGRSFPRFYNWGEVADEMPLFNFNEFVVDSKEDGSLCVLYHFNGSWHGNTRGSFGLDNMQFMDFSWREGFLKAMGVSSWEALDGVLDPSLSYICEFVSPWNKVVRTYAQPKMYLLTAFRGHEELTWAELDAVTGPFVRPERFRYSSIDEIMTFLLAQADKDKTFEGVVIRDNAGRRWKVKNPCYLALHRLRGEGDNLYNPKNLMPFIVAGEGDELLNYFSEVEPAFRFYQQQFNEMLTECKELWEKAKDEEDQKSFALKVKDSRMSGILFEARKTGKSVESILRASPERLVKNLKIFNPTWKRDTDCKEVSSHNPQEGRK